MSQHMEDWIYASITLASLIQHFSGRIKLMALKHGNILLTLISLQLLIVLASQYFSNSLYFPQFWLPTVSRYSNE